MASLSLLVDSNKIKHIKQTYFPKANVQNFKKIMHIIFISFTAFFVFSFGPYPASGGASAQGESGACFCDRRWRATYSLFYCITYCTVPLL